MPPRRLLPAGLVHLLIAALSPWPMAAVAGEFPTFEVQGLADFRVLHPSTGKSWLDGGLGKFRYAGGGDSALFRVNEVVLTARARLDWDWSASVTAKYADRQANPVDITEAVLAYRPAETGALRFAVRGGLFFPPVSLENAGTGWSSPYTLNSSAINSWVGEELRVLGSEAQLSYRFESGDRIGLFGAGFAMNDTAGALLAWRGWSLHDYEATLNDRLPIPNLSSIPAAFPLQAARTRPFVEVDGRPGYYLGATLERPGLGKLRVLYYDNRGNPSALHDGQYAWHTRFVSAGLQADLPAEVQLIAQGMTGATQMGDRRGGRFAVDSGFWAWSLLVTRLFGGHRLSVRHDQFGSNDRDYFPADPNGEWGAAWTVNYNYTVAEAHQFNLEFSHIDSRRPARALLSEPALQDENLWLVAYRFFF